jgi:tungstate transport system ATP-binding protein
VIEISGLCRKVGDRVLVKDINVTIPDGMIFGIIGPSGSGKTTLMRMIDLLDNPTSGTIVINGTTATRDKKQQLELRRKMGMVFQKPIVLSTTVFENVSYGLRFRGVKGEELKSRVLEAIDLVGLSGYEERYAPTLSGGEMQRVAIARSMVTRPEVLLLDEPTANLDPASTEKIEELIKTINARIGTTIIMSTHDLDQGQHIAHRIAVVIGGVITQAGTPEEVFHKPVNSEIARFVGLENIIGGTVNKSEEGLISISSHGKDVEAVSGEPVGSRVFISIHPDDITLHSGTDFEKNKSSARNCIVGTVTVTTLSGPFVLVTLDCGFPLKVIVTRRSVEDLMIQPGKEMQACFKASAVHVMKS